MGISEVYLIVSDLRRQ